MYLRMVPSTKAPACADSVLERQWGDFGDFRLLLINALEQWPLATHIELSVYKRWCLMCANINHSSQRMCMQGLRAVQSFAMG